MHHRLSEPAPTDSRRDRTRRVVILGVLITALCACDTQTGRVFRPTPTTPTAPSLPPAVTYALSGVVSEKTADGAVPVAGADVREERSGRRATTDAGGFYAITGLSQPTTAVVATKPGYATRRLIVSVSSDTRVDLEVTTLEGQTLSGIVFEQVAGGRVPIAGVEVYCDSCGSPFGHTFAETDAAGAYRFGWAHDGATPLQVRKEGYRLPGTGTGQVVATVAGSTRFDIELVRQ
jgi:hypothetical protein